VGQLDEEHVAVAYVVQKVKVSNQALAEAMDKD
jgi:hypothetical protein